LCVMQSDIKQLKAVGLKLNSIMINSVCKTLQASFCVIASVLIISCGADKVSSTESDVNENYHEVPSVEDFEVTQISGRFEPMKKGEGAIFNVELTIKNNTGNTINNIEIISGIKAQFRDDKTMYYPYPFSEYKSDAEYLSGPTAKQYGGINNIREKKKWMPSQTKTFKLRVFGSYEVDWSVKGFRNGTFERTPSTAEYIVAYKFQGLDGEYEDFFKFDILDLWKNYQTQIGLR
ncbi:hypothetical protein, partial [Microcoleus sp. F10-A1]|uniref:hypothetical protein n=1 Tax=Microcoleus sp. F10-A1 TaxID=2818750 RepID=UPI002FD3681C